MEKKMNLAIDGKSVVLNFGVNYFYKHFKDVSGIDMLADNIENIVSSDGIGMVAKMAFAGHKAEMALSRKDEEIPLEDFQHYYFSRSAQEFVQDVKELFAVINPPSTDTPGEAETQAAQP